MVLSMTGFASKTATLTLTDGSKVHVSISLKTLNSRFFETTCKISHAINYLETKIIKLLKPKLIRGHTYITIHVLNPQALKGSIKPSVPVIQGYVAAIDSVKKHLKIEGVLTVSDLLRLPDVFESEEKEIDKEFEQQLLNTISELADTVTKNRAQEGKTLEKDLKARFSAMSKEILAIEKSAATLVANKKEEITQLIKDLEATESETTDSRKSALLISLDKMDIHEEIVRFKSHLESIKEQLATDSLEKSKRLDFTLQELAREINTLSSKCSAATITSQAINIKVELEKSREQTQNIV